MRRINPIHQQRPQFPLAPPKFPALPTPPQPLPHPRPRHPVHPLVELYPVHQPRMPYRALLPLGEEESEVRRSLRLHFGFARDGEAAAPELGYGYGDDVVEGEGAAAVDGVAEEGEGGWVRDGEEVAVGPGDVEVAFLRAREEGGWEQVGVGWVHVPGEKGEVEVVAGAADDSVDVVEFGGVV